MRIESPPPALSPWRRTVYRVIFEADTPSGWAFDVALIAAIVTSVAVVMFESVAEYRALYGPTFRAVEWGFTVLFTVEYLLRLVCVRRPARYAVSFFGVIDLLAIIPTYLSLFVAGTQYLIVVRILRVLRLFRILKLARYVGEGNVLLRALLASRRKIFVFLCAVVSLLVVIGSVMYVIEGELPDTGFTDIPTSIYWAVVTLTTVGYGDIIPQTPVGKALASLVMIIGYGIIAIPTGIVTAELAAGYKAVTTRVCPSCTREGHDADATFCKFCSKPLVAPAGADDPDLADGV